jgi:hypothetical protein
MDTMNWTYDGDRDCPGNPGRLFGCRCQVHRPDLYYGIANVYHAPDHGVTFSTNTATTTGLVSTR